MFVISIASFSGSVRSICLFVQGVSGLGELPPLHDGLRLLGALRLRDKLRLVLRSLVWLLLQRVRCLLRPRVGVRLLEPSCLVSAGSGPGLSGPSCVPLAMIGRDLQKSQCFAVELQLQLVPLPHPWQALSPIRHFLMSSVAHSAISSIAPHVSQSLLPHGLWPTPRCSSFLLHSLLGSISLSVV